MGRRRRRHTAARRIRPHPYLDNPDAGGTCVHCRLIERSEVHLAQLPTVDQAVTDLEARRMGERPDP